MTEFNHSLWADARFAQNYREQADYFIQERRELFRVLRSFFRHFVRRGSPVRVCDLGCGDGVIAAQLLEEDASVVATMIDGSEEMLAAARKRLAAHQHVSYVRQSFEELIAESAAWPRSNLVVSAFAIHHLSLPGKQALFQSIGRSLQPGGFFLNIDTVFPDNAVFTDWYYAAWQDWVDARDRELGLNGAFKDIALKARLNPDNQLSSLSDQLQALRKAHFQNVECHYKNGLFAIYGGMKPN